MKALSLIVLFATFSNAQAASFFHCKSTDGTVEIAGTMNEIQGHVVHTLGSDLYVRAPGYERERARSYARGFMFDVFGLVLNYADGNQVFTLDAAYDDFEGEFVGTYKNLRTRALDRSVRCSIQ